MHESEAFVTTIGQKLDRLEKKLDQTQAGLDIANAGLKKLPENYLQKEEAEIRAARLRKVLAGFAVVGFVVASTLGVTLYTTHQTTCGVRGVLILARSSASRNPVPPDLPPEQRESVERQRAQAAEFYTNALKKLPVLWGC